MNVEIERHITVRQALAADLDGVEDARVEAATAGSRLLALRLSNGRIGLCSLLPGVKPRLGAITGVRTLRLIVDFLGFGPGIGVRRTANPNQAPTLAMAALNGLFAPPPEAVTQKAQDLILEKGSNKRVAVVGHFPFVEKMGEKFAAFDVLERRPRPGDLDADMAAQVLPQADVVAITGTSILNGTADQLLTLCQPEAFVIMLGPSTPFAPSLFKLGVNALAGAVVKDPDAVLAGVAADLPFKQLQGAQSLVWVR